MFTESVVDTDYFATLFQDSDEPSTVRLPDEERPRRERWSAQEIQDKIAGCCTYWKRYFKAETGKRHMKPFRCRIFHSEHGHCQQCLEHRATLLCEQIRQGVQNATANNHHVYWADVNASKRNSIARKYGKANYVAYPQPDGMIRIFYESTSTDGIEGAAEVDMNASLLFWIETARTPIGMNVSGNLGKNITATPSGEKEEEDSIKEKAVKVEITEIIVAGLTSEEDEAATRSAYLETIDAQPTTQEELEKALTDRTQAYIRAVIKRGGKIVQVESVRHRVFLSQVKWDTNIDLLSSEIEVPVDKGRSYWQDSF